MIFRRIWCDVGDLIYGCTLLLVLATANSIREYDNPCNETLYIGGSSYTQAGVIKFGFDPTFLNKSYSCKVTIETGIGRKIRYKFLNVRLDGEIECANFISLQSLRENGESASFVKYCDANEIVQDLYTDSTTTEIQIFVNLSSPSHQTHFNFDFYSIQYGRCNPDEILCNACIHQSLACGPDRNKYCTDFEPCSDITSSHNGSVIVGAVISSLIIIFLVVITCVFCWRRNNIECVCGKQCCRTRSSTSNTTSQRAMSIFALQLATRGVDGRDNRAYTEDGEPIDMSLAEPPPEYSSLENIERVGETSETNDVTSADLPPTYEEAIRNRDHYKIESDDVTVI
ncbi:uncharacterized protein LOC128207476 [Mya arenaria]|uniref:uncharacterized protein LOC128207476 n=1 Tax=Mya arenaria TaxID=6604 RepID=UPI0022E537BA|nr:uncharacterized protein LOC128207476 [Mya arenaria]